MPNLVYGSVALAVAPARQGDLGSHLGQLAGSGVSEAGVGPGHNKVLTPQVLAVGGGAGRDDGQRLSTFSVCLRRCSCDTLVVHALFQMRLYCTANFPAKLNVEREALPYILSEERNDKIRI